MNLSLKWLGGLTAGLLAAGSAGAVEFEMGGAAGTISTKVSAGAAWRLKDQSPELIGHGNGGTAYSTNGDDGNLAWDKGDMVTGAIKVTSDLSLTMGDYGLFVRGSGLHNPVLDGADYFDPADYQPNPQKEQPLSELRAKEEAISDHVGTDFDLLDAYVFGRFTLGERSLLVKAGRQVLNWGESVFVQHGLNALITADVNQLRVPGWEIEEVQTPVGMAVVSLDLLENVGIEAFYQYEWQPTIIDAPGTFLSTNDFAGIGGTQANIGFGRVGENADNTTICQPTPPPPGLPNCVGSGSTVPRGPTVKPEDGGQFGAKLSVYVPWLNDMDLAFYAAQYHSRLPVLSGTSRTTITSAVDTATYFVEYPEDISLAGVSFNTTVPWLDVAVQGEYSLKQGQPLQIDDVELLLNGLGAPNQINNIPGGSLGNQYLRGWRRHDVSQVDLSVTKVLGPLPMLGYDQLSLFVESGFVHVRDLPSPRKLAYDAPATYTPNAGTAAMNPSTAAGLPITPYEDYADTYSWGYKAAVRSTYNNVFGVFTVEPTVLWQQDIRGTTPTPIVNFVEGRKQLNFILSVNYLQAWTFDLGYATFGGAGARNLLTDRDYVDFAIKYSF